MPQPPSLSPDQRAAALAKAAAARRARAELKEKLKMGSVTLEEVLEQAANDDVIAKLKVLALLESLPGIGKVGARELMAKADISDNRRVQGLGDNQRSKLFDELGKERGQSLIIVIFGPGGAGKGTIVEALLQRDPRLHLSRSWTTRSRRQGEPEDAYVFVDRETFEKHTASGGFLEWVEFLPGQLSGTPQPEPPAGADLLLEIDLRGAQQIKARFPEARCILVVPPSRAVQEQRLVGRGDNPERVAQRLELAAIEESEGRELADLVVVNDELNRAVEEVAGTIEAWRSSGTP